MSVQIEVLEAARRLCRERDGWRFRPDEVVRALPHLNASTVRTHIVSRCCVNAPSHHPHRWAYFRRVARGVYEILPTLRHARPPRPAATAARAGAASRVPRAPRAAPPARTGLAPRVAEAADSYGQGAAETLRDAVHAVVTRDRAWYVAECLEVAVVTQGRTLDELVVNLREAVALHLEGGDAASAGLVPKPRISLTYEIRARTG